MPGQAFRLEYSLLALQQYEDGRTALRVLQPGIELVVVSPEKDNGMLDTVCDGARYNVFAADLAARATVVVPEFRQPTPELPRKGPDDAHPPVRLPGRVFSR